MSVNLGLDRLFGAADDPTAVSTGLASRMRAVVRGLSWHSATTPTVTDARVAAAASAKWTSANIAARAWGSPVQAPVQAGDFWFPIRLTKADAAKRYEMLLSVAGDTTGGEEWEQVAPATTDAAYDYFQVQARAKPGDVSVEYRRNPFGSAATLNAGAAAGNVPVLGIDGQVVGSQVPDATVTRAGKLEFASVAEVTTGRATRRAVSPARVKLPYTPVYLVRINIHPVASVRHRDGGLTIPDSAVSVTPFYKPEGWPDYPTPSLVHSRGFTTRFRDRDAFNLIWSGFPFRVPTDSRIFTQASRGRVYSFHKITVNKNPRYSGDLKLVRAAPGHFFGARARFNAVDFSIDIDLSNGGTVTWHPRTDPTPAPHTVYDPAGIPNNYPISSIDLAIYAGIPA